jgi:hypothetical protein
MFGQTYKVGDTTTYTFNMTQSSGNVVSASTVTQAIIKVYDNGDADMTQTITDMTMSMDGKPITIPPTALQPITMRVNKYGSPQGLAKGSATGGYAAAFEQFKDGISVGQTVAYSYSPPTDANAKTTGKLTFVSQDSAANFHMSADTTGQKSGFSHVEGDMRMDPTTHKLVSMDMTITLSGNLQSTSHMVMKLKSP